jgi:hypothetical protein
MPVIRNSARAFISALLFLVAFHGVMSVLGLGTILAKNVEPPSPDRAFQIFAVRVGIDAALLFAGHWLLRSFGLATRLAYGLMGGAAAAVGYAFALSQDLNLLPPLDGTRLTASVLPILVGMIAATMYAQFAGREMAPARNGGATTPDSAPASAVPAIFDGPVQVRTSMVATAIASMVPAAMVALVVIPFVTSGASQNPVWGKSNLPNDAAGVFLHADAVRNRNPCRNHYRHYACRGARYPAHGRHRLRDHRSGYRCRSLCGVADVHSRRPFSCRNYRRRHHGRDLSAVCGH